MDMDGGKQSDRGVVYILMGYVTTYDGEGGIWKTTPQRLFGVVWNMFWNQSYKILE